MSRSPKCKCGHLSVTHHPDHGIEPNRGCYYCEDCKGFEAQVEPTAHHSAACKCGHAQHHHRKVIDGMLSSWLCDVCKACEGFDPIELKVSVGNYPPTFQRGKNPTNETCLLCGKHVRYHFGGTENRCFPEDKMSETKHKPLTPDERRSLITQHGGIPVHRMSPNEVTDLLCRYEATVADKEDIISIDSESIRKARDEYDRAEEKIRKLNEDVRSAQYAAKRAKELADELVKVEKELTLKNDILKNKNRLSELLIFTLLSEKYGIEVVPKPE